MRPFRTRLCLLAVTAWTVVLSASSAYAEPHPPDPPTVDGVISGLTGWLQTLLVGLATLYLTIGGVRYLTAGGDPTNAEKGKTALKYAAIGYAIAALADVLVAALQNVVGK